MPRAILATLATVLAALPAMAMLLLPGWLLAAPAPACPPWNPAHAPYRGDAAAAVMRLDSIPAADRATLAMMAGQRFGGQRVMVSRNGIVGANLDDLRDMNGAGGQVCPGPVDRSHWPAGRHEAAWAYTVGRHSVVVLDSCGNVAVATNLDALPAVVPTREGVRAAQAARRGLGLAGLLGTDAPQAVPEPGTWALVGVALLAVCWARRGRA